MLRRSGRPSRSGPSAAGAVPEATRFLYGYLLGGLRAPVVGFYWLKVDLQYRKGRYFALEKDLRVLAELNPSSPQVWDYAAWHQAFNVVRRAATPEERFRHRYEGLRLARQGLERLPTCRQLLLRLGLIAGQFAGEDGARFRQAESGTSPEAVVFEAFARLREAPDGGPEDGVLFAGAAERWAIRLLIDGDFGRAAEAFRAGLRELERYRQVVSEPAATAAAVELRDVAWIVQRAGTWLRVAEHGRAARDAAANGDRARSAHVIGQALAALEVLEDGPEEVVEEERDAREAVRRTLVALGATRE
ncbi:MAG: hypothetical protein JXQ29_07725 [Planctomycetes bacterium]|nr:hypothetical protein [Planctomycetota bacterium]